MAKQLHKVYLLSPYLEGELTQTQRKAVELHLRACAYCRQEFSLLRRAIDALDEVPLEETSADFLVKLKRRMDQATPPWRAKEPYTQRQVPAAPYTPLSVRQVLDGVRVPPWCRLLVPWRGGYGRLLPSPLTVVFLAALVTGLMFTLFVLRPPRELASAKPEQASPGISVQARPPSAATPPPVPGAQALTQVPHARSLPVEDAPPGVEPGAGSFLASRGKEAEEEADFPTHLAYDKE